MGAIRKLVWAVDVFEGPEQVLEQAAREIRGLMKHGLTEVEAIYVLSPSQLNVSIEFSGPWIKQYKPAAEAALNALIQRLNLEGIARPHVIVQNFPSSLHAVKALIEQAELSGADAILANTHGRTGFSRLLMGSFAESLLHHSSVPVLILGPKNAIRPLNQILFPTEFGPYSKDAFRRAVSLAKDTGASVTLFHAVPHPIEPILQSGAYLLGGSWVPVSTYFSDETDRARRRAEAWIRWARGQGVRSEVVVDTIGGSVAESIVKIAERKNIGLIVMEAQSGPVASVLIGSVTRQVVRESGCPVLVIRMVEIEKAERMVRRAA